MSQPAKSEISLCLFAKAPRPGEAKTRLAPALGTVGASQLAKAMLLDSLELWHRLDDSGEAKPELLVFESGEMDAELESCLARHERFPQAQGDLGTRVEGALRRALERSEVAVVVGSDVPGMGGDDLRETRRLLESHDAVLGPTTDGGFSLLALRSCPDGLLANLPWSCESTLGHTRRRLEGAGMSVALLAERFDIDDPGDLPALTKYLQEHHRCMPRTREFLKSSDNLSISVIIPVLNEQTCLPDVLRLLQQHAGIIEIIVVDGGSSDDTVAIAEASGRVRLLHSPPGRAVQMNLGAQAATGGVLLFLHADVELPQDACQQIHQSLASQEELAGAFRLHTRYDKRGRFRPWIRPFLKLADMRSYYSDLPYGDQALFVRAEVFRLLGGFPLLPLFEDLALSSTLRRLRPLVIAKGPVQVSGRRFQERPFYYLALMNSFPLLYRLGVSPEWLARFYRHSR
ncbi:MAG: TIGR04283 family arsenosugar biosynthesis glycosyltransferase [Kofleriaceae bacterium]|nr:TIGR04283 family arsenosugar biosynthesis glycosyltransferase [Kofleriaceae bacterium]